MGFKVPRQEKGSRLDHRDEPWQWGEASWAAGIRSISFAPITAIFILDHSLTFLKEVPIPFLHFTAWRPGASEHKSDT